MNTVSANEYNAAGALFAPFRGLLAAPGRAAEVAAPPYDVVNRNEATAAAAQNPISFLHASRAEVDLPDIDDPYCDAVYAKAADTFSRFISDGVLVRDEAAAFYIWRLEAGTHSQTGVVAAASVAAYEGGRIMRHEFTRPDKETDRVRHMEALSAATGPTLLAHRPAPALMACVAAAAKGDPVLSIDGPGGVRHTLWRVAEPGLMQDLGAALEALPAAYIADGHHRTAAAARVARERGISDGRFLSVLFPSDELLILDYNRVVRDFGGLAADEFLKYLAPDFDVMPMSRPAKPTAPHQFVMHMSGRWFQLDLHVAPGEDAAPVERLDVAILSARILEPLLGIKDPRTDPRIDFVGGARGLDGLAERVESGKWAAAFALYPTAMNDLMDVADAGGVMPPKSTWFEPKLADGLVSLVLD